MFAHLYKQTYTFSCEHKIFIWSKIYFTFIRYEKLARNMSIMSELYYYIKTFILLFITIPYINNIIQ